MYYDDLVGGIPTPLKNMKATWDDEIPNIWKVISNSMVPVTTKQLRYLGPNANCGRILAFLSFIFRCPVSSVFTYHGSCYTSKIWRSDIFSSKFQIFQWRRLLHGFRQNFVRSPKFPGLEKWRFQSLPASQSPFGIRLQQSLTKQRGKRAIVESDITGNTLRVSNFNNTTPRECC